MNFGMACMGDPADGGVGFIMTTINILICVEVYRTVCANQFYKKMLETKKNEETNRD